MTLALQINSPRSVVIHYFSLEYIAYNLDSPMDRPPSDPEVRPVSVSTLNRIAQTNLDRIGLQVTCYDSREED